MPTLEQLIPYLYGSVSIMIIILLYIAYNSWRIKRMIKREIESQNQNY